MNSVTKQVRRRLHRLPGLCALHMQPDRQRERRLLRALPLQVRLPRPLLRQVHRRLLRLPQLYGVRLWRGPLEPELRRGQWTVSVPPGLHGTQVRRVRERLLLELVRRGGGPGEGEPDVLVVQLQPAGDYRGDLLEGPERRVSVQAELYGREMRPVRRGILRTPV